MAGLQQNKGSWHGGNACHLHICNTHPCPQVEDDSLLDAKEIPETGYVDESGQLRRPWCPATRILDHREAAAEAAAAEEKRRAAQTLGRDGLGLEAPEPPPRTCFPEVKEGEPLYQKNEGEGGWWEWERVDVYGTSELVQGSCGWLRRPG